MQRAMPVAKELPGYRTPTAPRDLLAGVRYYARGERVRELLEGEVAALSATSLFEVREWVGVQEQQVVRAR